jgi:hypothetical protein
MKKFLFGLTLVLSIMVILSCKSLETQEAVDNAFQKIYDKYYESLILDGAANFTVATGNTLSGISQTYYHNEYHFPLIMLASHDIVKDPDMIRPGMKLTIPDLQKNLGNASTKAQLKLFYVDISRLYDKRDKKEAAKNLRQLAATM